MSILSSLDQLSALKTLQSKSREINPSLTLLQRELEQTSPDFPRAAIIQNYRQRQIEQP